MRACCCAAFQSTRPRGARPGHGESTAPLCMFQSTRPRGARPSACAVGSKRKVSIHAPARGATFQRSQCRRMRSFNPRAAWGATEIRHASRCRRFQSTRPRGRDHAGVQPCVTVAFQSTRPRGRDILRCESRRSRFNPRARVGRDGQCRRCMVSMGAFQSTRPVGRDVGDSEQRCSVDEFQSTRPRGARQTALEVGAPIGFKSTRPRGARRLTRRQRNHWGVSIHAPAWGATKGVGWYQRRRTRFQSTRPRGARRCHDSASPNHSCFKSTRPRGARPARWNCGRSMRQFQSTRPRGARPL